MLVKGGFTNYGQEIGIIMLDTVFPRLPGDVGNANTFHFPVRYKVVKGASPQRVVKECDPTLLEPFLDAARELEREGVKAIATSCGFLAIFQREMANAVSIPVFSSSLLQIPLARAVIGDGRRVGIITARSQSLSEKHFAGVNAQHTPAVIVGMEKAQEFTSVFVEGKTAMDTVQIGSEMILTARRLVQAFPDVGAIVLECANMPPYAKMIQDDVRLPVFDIVSLINYAFSVVVRKNFRSPAE